MSLPTPEGFKPHHVTNRQQFMLMCGQLRGVVSYDIETNCLYPWQRVNDKGERDPAHIHRLGFGTALGEFSVETAAFDPDELETLLRNEVTPRLEKCLTVMQNGKFDALWTLVHYGLQWKVGFDTMLADYIVDENRWHDLESIAKYYRGAQKWDIDLKTKKGLKDQTILTHYHCLDLYWTRRLYKPLREAVDKDERVARVFDKILTPLVDLFVEVEFDGVMIELDQWETAEKALRQMYAEREAALKQYGNVNWGSRDEVAKLLFTTLGIKPPMLTPKGKPSTAESALNQIDHPCVSDLIKFREAKQQLSFFIEGWRPFMTRRYQNGKLYCYLHPSFKIGGTVTGRLSCERPNLQQVPRDPRIRSLIGAEDGWTLIEVDLSQIELRIVAELSRDPELVRCFNSNVDVHWRTALGEIERSGGEYGIQAIHTAKLYLMQLGLRPDGASAKAVRAVFRENKERQITSEILLSCCQDGEDQAAWRGERRSTGGKQQPIVDRWMRAMGDDKLSEGLLRALRELEACCVPSQGREQKEQSPIQFADAMSILSLMGPSTASELFDGWKEARKKAKAVGFGFVYGMWWKKFKMYARDNYGVEITDKQAQESRTYFFQTYSSLEDWHKRQKRFARMNGYVRSLSGRKRRLPNAMLAEDSPARGNAERQAVNSPVQSFGNEINLMTALQLRQEFGRDVLKMCGTVHDAILMRAKNSQVARVTRRALEIMERPALFDTFEINLSVPIKGEAKVGNWGKGIDLEKWEDVRRSS